MAQLVLNNNNSSSLLSLDLTLYMQVTEGKGMDPAAPQFAQRVWSRSLLKEGATLALEQLTEKELVFPLLLGPVPGAPNKPTNLSQTLQLIAQINQVVESPGFTVSWQPLGASQPTIFDGLSGHVEVQYSYRKENQFWTEVLLRLFTAPLGRAGAPRVYATASGTGPMLMISPYASSGALSIGASTQAGVAGYGGGPAGTNSNVFYWGQPSLAGDAPAELQISYVGPLPNTATMCGTTPYAAVSVLPDQFYQPLITSPQITFADENNATFRRTLATSPAGSYLSFAASPNAVISSVFSFQPLPAADTGFEPTARWAGQQRVLAIARASSSSTTTSLSASMQLLPGQLTPGGPGVQVVPGGSGGGALPVNGDWGLYDMGTFALRPSEFPIAPVRFGLGITAAGGSMALDVAAFVMLPDSQTWFVNPTSIQASQYGYPAAGPLNLRAPSAPWTNTIVLDDTLADQFLYAGPSQTFAPSPLGSVPSSARITQYARGLVPRPDPNNGLPVIAIVGVGQTIDRPISYTNILGQTRSFGGGSQANPQNLSTFAQVNVLERARYVLP